MAFPLVVIGIQIVDELLGDRTRSGFQGLSGPFLAILGPPYPPKNH